MKSAPELIALLHEAQVYIAVRASCGLAPDPEHDRITELAAALAELPPADKTAEQRVRDAIWRSARRRADLRVIEGTKLADSSIADVYEHTDATGWVAETGGAA